MIGWVPYVLSAFIEEVAGPSARRDILAGAGLEPDIRFRIDSNYADAVCRRILDGACAYLRVTEDQAFDAFAPFFLQKARDMFPGFFDQRPDVRAFLLHQPEVHNTLSAGLIEGDRSLVASKFRIEPADGGLKVFYRSPNRMAGLYVAVAEELGRELGQPTRVRFLAGGPRDAECVMIVEVDAEVTRPAA